jgi:hypothetical protein
MPTAVIGGIASTMSFDEQVDPEVADRRPMIVVILLQPGRMMQVELNPVAAHMSEQVDQRRHRRIK